jgi:hypothetical protein
VERSRKAGQNPPRVVAPIEEEEEGEEEERGGVEEEEEDRNNYGDLPGRENETFFFSLVSQ